VCLRSQVNFEHLLIHFLGSRFNLTLLLNRAEVASVNAASWVGGDAF